MDDIRKEKPKSIRKVKKIKLILDFLNRKKFKIILIIFIITILLFPVWSGTLIGTWINDFLGNIINHIKF
jgi:hypothetical protein